MYDNFNKRIIFKKPVKTKDGRGGWTSAYTIIDTVWGAIDSLKAFERSKYMSIYPGVDVKLIIRYHPTIATFKSKCRAYFGTKYYDIKGMVNPGESNKFLEFVAIETVNKDG